MDFNFPSHWTPKITPATLLPDEVEHGRSGEKSEVNHKKRAESAAVRTAGTEERTVRNV